MSVALMSDDAYLDSLREAHRTSFSTVFACTLRRDATDVVAADSLGRLRTWPLKTTAAYGGGGGSESRIVAQAAIYSLDGLDSSGLVAGCADGSVVVVDEEASLATRSTMHVPAEANGVSAQRNVVHVACGDGNVYVCDLITAQRVATMRGHGAGAVYCVRAFGEHMAASGADDGTCRVWDRRTGGEVMHFAVGALVSCVDVDSSGSWLVFGDGAQSLALHRINASPKTPIAQIAHMGAVPNAVVFPSNSAHVGFVTASSDGSVQAWRLDGTMRARLPQRSVRDSALFTLAAMSNGTESPFIVVAGRGSSITAYVDDSIAFKLS